MRIRYDADVDVLTVVLNDNPVVESNEEKPGVVIDFDEHGNIVAFEILDASKRVDEPRNIEMVS